MTVDPLRRAEVAQSSAGRRENSDVESARKGTVRETGDGQMTQRNPRQNRAEDDLHFSVSRFGSVDGGGDPDGRTGDEPPRETRANNGRRANEREDDAGTRNGAGKQ